MIFHGHHRRSYRCASSSAISSCTQIVNVQVLVPIKDFHGLFLFGDFKDTKLLVGGWEHVYFPILIGDHHPN